MAFVARQTGSEIAPGKRIRGSVKMTKPNSPAKRPAKVFQPDYGAGVSPFADLVPSPPRATGLTSGISAKISAFAAKKGNGKWPNLPRANIATRLKSLTSGKAGAVKLYQDGINACGPAAAMYLFAREKPEAFCDLAIALYDKGKGSFGSLDIHELGLAGHDPLSWKSALGAPKGTFWNGLSVDDWLCDWMLLSSLRRTEDAVNAAAVFDGKPDDGASGITWPKNMAKWLRKGVGYSTVNDETNLVFNKDLDHLKKLAPDTDTTVVLLINVTILQGGTKKEKKHSKSESHELGKGVLTAFPDHYCVLEKAVPTKDTDKVEVWSWGRMMQLPPLSDTAKWKEAYFGALIAKK